MGGNNRLYGIQVVRGIACLGILLAHSCAYAEMNFSGLDVAASLDFWCRYGLLYFTEIFFAISGFFLSASIDKINSNAKFAGVKFLVNKFLRIYPLYYLAVAIAVLLRIVIQGQFVSTPNFYKTIFLLPISDVPYVLNVEWTLLIEVMFFVVASVFATARRKKCFPVAMGIWGCVIILSIAIGKSNYAISLTTPQIFVTGRCLAFIVGTGVYFVYKKILRDKLKITELTGKFSVAVLLVLYLLNYQSLLHENPAMLLGRVSHYLILVALVVCAACSPIRPSALSFFGDHSYAIYLIHPTILDLSFHLFDRWGYEFQWWMCIVACSASLIAGVALGKVETWLNAGIKKCIMQLRNIPWRKYMVYGTLLFFTMGCFVVMKGVKDISSLNREKASDYIAESFDAALVAISPSDPGWIDVMEIETLSDGTRLLYASGWAYDSLTDTQAEKIVVLVDGKSVPTSIAWHDRPGVSEALGIPVPVSCGFTLQAQPIPAEGDIVFYVTSKDGYYLQLLQVK